MDGYVSKTVSVKDLLAAVDDVSGPGSLLAGN